ncbi:SDR family oxidoreductase [Parashewanella curva]|uniref:SDR family oxidoreductase n=1 Tax=Parashewanella curva TaxID=2338552 RepID=A0A3L8PWH9_9GAMM|nr:SDR family oxidoreductase [Parashewanella curva]RLV59716.1 SDR family oxidoreductase [Parashewanella curva]
MQKVMIVTGGSRGIGYAVSQHFKQAQFKVINLSRSPNNIQDTLNLKTDLSSPTSLKEHQARLIQELEGATQVVIVHCAAGHTGDTIFTANAETLNKDLAINIVSPTLLNQMLLPHMPESSSVIFIGSTLSEKAVPGCYSYVTSKHAVIGMMRSVCQDLAGKGVHTACICPGFTDTEMLREHISHEPEAEKSISQMVTFGRLIAPEEIAKTVFFTANTPAINGSVIHANLGQIER